MAVLRKQGREHRCSDRVDRYQNEPDQACRLGGRAIQASGAVPEDGADHDDVGLLEDDYEARHEEQRKSCFDPDAPFVDGSCRRNDRT